MKKKRKTKKRKGGSETENQYIQYCGREDGRRGVQNKIDYVR